MNIKKIQEIIQLMSDNDLTEIEIEHEGTKIHIIKRPHGIIEQQVFSAPAVQVNSAGGAVETSGRQEVKSANTSEIKSPMVGTFYRAASPDDSPYVQIGDVIHKGDVLCIIEAMKLMNEVKAEIDGKIVGIPVENAESVEFGQPMFIIEPV